MKPTAKIDRIIQAYAKQKEMDPVKIKLKKYGKILDQNKTVQENDLKDEDKLTTFSSDLNIGEVKQKEQILNIIIETSDRTLTEIRAKPSTKVEKLLQAYAYMKSLNPHQFKLMDHEGRSLNPNDTLVQSEVEDGDKLSLVMHQIGGNVFHHSSNILFAIDQIN